MNNISEYIKSFMVVISNNEDDHKSLIEYLKIAHFIYSVIGNNINKQFIIIIYNISSNDAMHLSDIYKQENIIYGIPIGKKFNIKLSFFEQVEKVCTFIEGRMRIVENSRKLLSESIDNSYTGKHRMICRYKLYKQK